MKLLLAVLLFFSGSTVWAVSDEDSQIIYECVVNEFNEHIDVVPSVGEVVFEQARLVVATELGLATPAVQQRFDSFLLHYEKNLAQTMASLAKGCVEYYISKHDLAELMAREDNDIEKTFAITNFTVYFMGIQEAAAKAQNQLQAHMKKDLAQLGLVTSMEDQALLPVINGVSSGLGEVLVNTYIYAAIVSDQDYMDALYWLQKRYMHPEN